MTEKEIERRMCEMVRKLGGLTYKFLSSENGVPDRIVIVPGGKVWFVELKTKKGRLSRIQSFQVSKLKRVAANVRVVYGFDEMTQFVEEVMSDGQND